MGVVFGKREAAVETISAAQTLAPTDTGKTFVLDAAEGATVTLPALANGFTCRFVVGAAFATSNWVIASAEGDNINGFIADMGTTVAVVVASDEDQINFVASAERIGDYVDFVADSGNSQWIVSGACGANGGITATDPA